MNFTLPSGADNQSFLEIRIITADAVGADAMIGIDDIVVSSADINEAPTLTATPLNTGFTEGGTAAPLFANASASTVESGQLFTSLVITISNVSDAGEESSGLHGRRLTAGGQQ